MFTHLHVHSHYSLLSALGSPKRMVKRAKELGMNALALTDHNVSSGLVEFYKKCKDEDIKPILGIDMNIAYESIDNRGGREDAKNYQIVLLAENYIGYQNILQLSTKAHLEGFYYQPRIDHEILQQHGEGLIALTGGLRGAIPKALLQGDVDKAKFYLDLYHSIFGKDSVFIEIQYHPEVPEQTKLNELLINFARQNDAPLVAAQSVYYPSLEEKESHEVLLCIRDGKNMHDENRYQPGDNFSLLSEDNMKAAWKELPEALENTSRIAQRCQVELPLGQLLLPKFETPEGFNEESYLRHLCEEGLVKRYGTITQELQERLDYELGVIHTMGYDAYFLIVWDFIYYAKTHDIMVGPGRGSAAGSIVAYALEITDIDPIHFGLIFERFLNPARVTMPDIDIDFIDTKRDQMIQYVQEKYGRDRVAQIATFGTMAARAAVRDATRALGYPYGVGDRIAKLIPPLGSKLREALESEAMLKEVYQEKEAKHIIDTAIRMEGVIRNTSVHAAAVVISDRPLVEITALQEASKGEGVIVTQYSMYPIEELGLLKMDFLGLKNLGVLEMATKIIEKLHRKKVDLKNLSLSDEKTYTMLSQGETTGIFQFESGGMRHYLKELQPSSIDDLIAMTSLYRPGPMDYIPQYISGKRGEREITYLDPCLRPILKETYGIAVYQEQVQKIAQAFAGYSLAEADLLRRAIGKKIKSEVDKQKIIFIEKAVQNGKTEELAEKLFSFIEPFARYGFNKSHAACYAIISYQTAYLKANYPVEYMTALLSCDSGNQDKIIGEIADCRRMGIKILPPSINESYASFSVSPDGKSIRFGLEAIKNIGEGPARAILEARQDSPFVSIADFMERIDSKFAHRKVIESLAKVGALDDFAERNQIIENIDILLDYSRKVKKQANSSQIDLFASFSTEEITDLHLPEMIPATLDERMLWEKEFLGVYVSSHPLNGLQRYFQRYVTPINSLEELHLESIVRIGGIISYVRVISTKKGDRMAFVTIEDQSSELEIVVFSRTFQNIEEILEEGNIVVAEIKISSRERNGEEQRTYILNKIRSVDVDRARKLDDNVDSYPDDSSNNVEVNNKGVVKLAEKHSHISQKESSQTFVISIPRYADRQTLEQIKHILKSHPGNDQGLLRVTTDESTMHEIRLPFGVAWNTELESQIQSFLDPSLIN